MKSQQAYILLSCLILISFISIISLAILEQVIWQQKKLQLLTQTSTTQARYLTALPKLSQLFSSQGCHLATAGFAELITEPFSHGCLLKQQGIEWRYGVVQAQHIEMIYVVGREKLAPWEKWLILKNN